MKKLIFSLVLTLTAFVAMEAQTLFINVVNNSTGTWRLGFTDGDGDLANPALNNVTPGTHNSSISNFNFDLNWDFKNLTNGCSNLGTITAPVGSTTLSVFCTVAPPPNSGTSITYTVAAIGGGDYQMKVVLD